MQHPEAALPLCDCDVGPAGLPAVLVEGPLRHARHQEGDSRRHVLETVRRTDGLRRPGREERGRPALHREGRLAAPRRRGSPLLHAEKSERRVPVPRPPRRQASSPGRERRRRAARRRRSPELDAALRRQAGVPTFARMPLALALLLAAKPVWTEAPPVKDRPTGPPAPISALAKSSMPAAVGIVATTARGSGNDPFREFRERMYGQGGGGPSEAPVHRIGTGSFIPG